MLLIKNYNDKIIKEAWNINQLKPKKFKTSAHRIGRKTFQARTLIVSGKKQEKIKQKFEI